MPEMKVSVMSHRSSERPHRITFRRVADLWCWNEMLLPRNDEIVPCSTSPALDLVWTRACGSTLRQLSALTLVRIKGV